MNRVYIAAKFTDQPKAKHVREILSRGGITVTASWIDQEGEFDEMTDRERAYCAMLDVFECSRADALVYLPHKDGASYGRCTEFGMKALQGDPIFILGEKEKSVFHYLPNVFSLEFIARMMFAEHGGLLSLNPESEVYVAKIINDAIEQFRTRR